MQKFNPLSLALQGRVLIEASAGTGKTYSIVLLFLRLLIEKELNIDEILVVTFTRAATAELRDRVRSRIREALTELESPGSQDLRLKELIHKISDREQTGRRLEDALTRMDEAAIYTIHGFCQRMLQEHAFELSALFELEFLQSEGLLRRRIIEDFWRLHFYASSKEEAQWLTDHWKEPEDLLQELSGHLSRPEVTCIPHVGNDEIKRQIEVMKPLFVQVQSLWQQGEKDITDLLNTAVRNKQLSGNNQNGYGPDRLSLAITAMQQLSAAGNMPLHLTNSGELALFTHDKIKISLLKKANDLAPEHTFFDLFQHFFTAHQEMSSCKHLAVLLEARDYLFSELDKRKKQRGQLYFNDLLVQLDATLQSRDGKRIAEGIGNRFPAILVDEFQDTDPKQYSIFSSIHGHAEARYKDAPPQENTVSPCLVLVGDPKQAIYGFRGAEIFTYLEAVGDTPETRQFTMGTNYRSTGPMVDAVNGLFGRERAFIFENIRYTAVSASDQNQGQTLLLDNTAVSPFNCLQLSGDSEDKPISKGDAHERAASYCAHEIARLLAMDCTERATIVGLPLEPQDIAVLVRTHNEAELVRKALSKLKISSVYSGQDSIFASEQARQLALVLASLLDLTNEARVRTALATELFGFCAEKLDTLRQKTRIWTQQMESLQKYRDDWKKHGFSYMFRMLLTREHLVQRIYHSDQGERALTNYIHLSELLQSEAPRQQGAEGLLCWLNEQIQSPEPNADEQQLRLESDENLVKIVTIHKAKGLEYPIVFLPFLWSARTCKKNEPLAFHPLDRPNDYLIYMGTDPVEREIYYELAEKERLAEDLRLVYVAFTRAKFSCYFCWGNIKQIEESALYYLLLDRLVTDLSCLNTLPWPEHFPDFQASGSTPHRNIQARIFKGNIDLHQPIISHTSLTNHSNMQTGRPDHDQTSSVQTASSASHDVFGFPKGAKAGICLHGILEDISFTDAVEHKQAIREHLSKAGIEPGWIPVVETWINDILATELSSGFSLNDVAGSDRLSEMSFYFSLNPIDWQDFNNTLKAFGHAPVDKYGTLQGYMRGFIDLIYRHEDRYYIADYKSNHLGNKAGNYKQNKLQEVMVSEHRYDLQYLIYTLAVHRYLAARIENYDYDRHFGGVNYLFLRGMNPKHETGTGIYFQRPPFKLIQELDRHCSPVEKA